VGDGSLRGYPSPAQRHFTFPYPHGVTPHSILPSLHIPSSRIPVGVKGPDPAGTRCDSSPPLGSRSHESGSYRYSSCRCGPFQISFMVIVNGFHLGQILLGFPRWVCKTLHFTKYCNRPRILQLSRISSTSHSSSPSTITGSGGGVTWLGSGSSAAAYRSETGNVRCFWIVAGISSS